MSRAEFYRSEANRAHAAAVASRDADDARRWREIAQGYQDIAERFERLYRIVRERLVLRGEHMQPAE